jgi:hypothetical protein
MEEQTADELVRAVRSFDRSKFNPEAMRNHALQWSARSFRARIRAAVEQVAADSPSGHQPLLFGGGASGQHDPGRSSRPARGMRPGSTSSRSSRHALA